MENLSHIAIGLINGVVVLIKVWGAIVFDYAYEFLLLSNLHNGSD
jgi:hypothetical protein